MTAIAKPLTIREQVSDQEWQARVDLAAAYRLVALYGWDDLIFTHISARVPGPEHHFPELGGARAEGNPVAGAVRVGGRQGLGDLPATK